MFRSTTISIIQFLKNWMLPNRALNMQLVYRHLGPVWKHRVYNKLVYRN
jgi:hypothetical protein